TPLRKLVIHVLRSSVRVCACVCVRTRLSSRPLMSLKASASSFLPPVCQPLRAPLLCGEACPRTVSLTLGYAAFQWRSTGKAKEQHEDFCIARELWDGAHRL